MIQNYIENANFEDTGFHYALSLISGKHKMVILYCLMEYRVVRFNELKRYLKNISDKTLSTNLKELEADNLIVKAKLFCPEIAGLFCRIAGLFCHDSRANLSLKPVCFGIAIS